LLQKWDKFLPLQNQRLMNLTPCDRLRLRSFVFQWQNGQPLAFEDCLALEARVHQFVGEDRVLIALVADAWRQTYPEAPTEIALPP
jgi:hypothetical protein